MKRILIHDQLPSVRMREHVQTLMCARTMDPLVPCCRRLKYKQVKMVGIPDPWIPRGCTRRPASPRARGSSILSKVSELIDPHTDSRDEQLVRDTFWPEDAEEILRILVNQDLQD